MRWMLLAQERMSDWWGGHPMAWGWGLWGVGMMLLFWALVTRGARSARKNSRRESATSAERRCAMTRRRARGRRAA